MPILPTERDPRLITVRRGGTLTDEHHRLLAEWAPYAPNTSCTFFDASVLLVEGKARCRRGG